MIQCPNCETLNDEENQFCGKCGTKLPEPKICPNCNYQSYENEYCTQCGIKLITKKEYDKKESLLKQAIAFRNNNEFDEVIECCDEILKINPGDLEALILKRRSCMDLGKFEEAIECCNKMIEFHSENSFSYSFKGDNLRELNKFEEAIECYNKSLLINPNYHSSYFGKGISLLELNKFDDALKCFDKALKIKNDDSFYWSIIVNKLIRLSKFEEAMDYCNRGLNYHPYDISLNYGKAILLGLNNKYLKAIDLILKYNLKGARIFNTVAHKFNLMGEFHKAKRFCTKSIDFDSQYYSSWLTMGEIYFNLEKYEESLKYFKKGFELSSVDKDEVINRLTKECQEFVKSNLFK